MFDEGGRSIRLPGSWDFLSRSIRLNPGESKRELFGIVLSNYYNIVPGEYTARFFYDPRLAGMELKPDANFLKWSDEFRLKLNRDGSLKIAPVLQH